MAAVELKTVTMSWDSPALRVEGFQGFVSAAELRNSQCQQVPDDEGVYLVLRPPEAKIKILRSNPACRYQGHIPTIPQQNLKDRWQPNAPVLYIGKAGKVGGRSTLLSRIRKFIQFGSGKSVAHWGGRAIWQLDQAWSLLFCWKMTGRVDPRSVERDLLTQFREDYGHLPFANLRL